MADKFFNTVRQVQVFGKVVDPNGDIPLELLDEIDRRDNLQNYAGDNAHTFPARKNNIYPKIEEQSLEEIARECKKRGNRLEVMNGKVYEVTRKFIKNVD